MPHNHTFDTPDDTTDLTLIGSRAARGLMNNCSQMHLWRLTNDPAYQDLHFPKPIRINGRNYFRISAVRQWIAERESASRAARIARPLIRQTSANAKQRIGGGYDR